MTIAERIRQLRLSLMVHSIIYYELNDNIISDAEWSKRAKELVELQEQHPDIAETVVFDDLYRGFKGDTGFDLAKGADEAAWGKAKYLLATRRKGRSK